MKILYLHQYFNTPTMSGGTRSYEMARRLVAAGHEVHMVTSDKNSSFSLWKTSVEAGIHVHWYGVPYSNKMNHLDRVKAFFQFASAAGRRVQQIKGDLVFATSTPLTIAIPGVRASQALNIPFVFEVRDLWPEVPIAMNALRDPVSKFLARRLAIYAYKHAAHIVALSPGMKDGVLAYGYPADQVTVIPNSSDLELFHVEPTVGEAFRKAQGWPSNQPVVVYTGAFGPANGLLRLVSLAAEVFKINPDVRFVLAGEGKEEELLKSAAKEKGIFDKSFFFLGKLSKSKMPALLSAASVNFCSFKNIRELWDCSPNKIFDGFAAGKPIVTNYGGWLSDLVSRERAGLFLHPDDSESISAKRLTNFLLDEEGLQQASRNSARLGVEVFSRDLLARQLEEVLLRVHHQHSHRKGRLLSRMRSDRQATRSQEKMISS